MNRSGCALAFLLGAAIVGWVGVGFVGSNTLALVMTVIIGAVYLFGAFEILEFRRATSTLAVALAAIPEQLTNLADWLDRLHPSLQNAVRLRIEGERIGLPGPALTPYLVGLLVMLGMLGTFLGMVVTLNGAAFALEDTTDLPAIRSALAAPIKGLGLAFGTSVAGVAASAMLGLISALSRRERMLTAQLLDTRSATVLRDFSLAEQRRETFKALQMQAQALPELVDKLQAMMERMEHREQQLNARLLGNQESFHSEVKVVYTNLAGSVEKTLKDSLIESAQAAGEHIKPAVAAAMTGIAREAKLMHERMIDSTQMQLDGFSARFGDMANSVADTWTTVLAKHQSTSEGLVNGMERSLAAFNATFEQGSGSLLASVGEALSTSLANQVSGDRQRLEAWTQSLAAMAASLQSEWHQAGAQALAQQQRICATLDKTARDITEQAQANASKTIDGTAQLLRCAEDLVRSRIAAESDWTTQHGERMEQMASLWRTELGALRDQEALRGNAAVEHLADLQAALTSHLTTLGAALTDPMTQLIASASEAPRAAAEVIGALRQEMTNSLARDNQLLEERSRIMESLNSLLVTINHASAEQREKIDSLVTSSTVLLGNAGSQFAEQVSAESARLSDIAVQLAGSAIEVSSLSEAFGFAVQLFSDANEKLIDNLQSIEASMDKSTARSDEQLAYYVAQAREVIDLSILSQKDVVEALRQLLDKQAATAEQVN
ncbi:DUF802 domain-containing protein [Accumulibacter sp.]|uniref:DUF802 domain-containing protein n=1 Tax=Accumulibacter sp. TaxID=2053492 RepID=UPI002C58A308|nr:DUF802 domain-containing protein [Accumulibacter sp.]HPU80090.1 DUF802 domain-containing protein [Accumulibacter sp.]